MTRSAPRLTIHHTGEAVTIDLPRRAVTGRTARKLLGPMLIVMGLIFAGAGARVVIGLHAIGADGGTYATHVTALILGSITLCFGLLAQASRASISAGDGVVVGIEHLGPLVRRHKLTASELSHFAVRDVLQRQGSRCVGGFGSIVLQATDGRSFVVAHNYPMKLLMSVAAPLAEALQFEHVIDDGDEQAFRNPTIIKTNADFGYFVPDVRATIRPTSNGISLLLPPLQPSSETSRTLRGGVLFTIVSGVGLITANVLPIEFTGKDKQILVGILSCLFAAGLLLFNLWWRRMNRQAAIDVHDGHLTIHMFGGMFGQQVYEWPKGTVTGISVESAIISWDDGREEIKIKSGYNSRRLFRYRHDHELPWIAEQLRDALELS
tara:strand:+ start:172 stop:1308 length:1137 start_codon:yes stop_codon:yes gene_type:complete